MSLRLRLIVAFLLLSVVPLAAVTLFSYASNARALREAAGRETQLLADELTQRMQLVTAQLTERVGHLMDLEEARAVAANATLARDEAVSTAGRTTVTTPGATETPAQAQDQVARALGEMAMLLNNVELRGMRGPRPPPPVDGSGGRGVEGRPASPDAFRAGVPRPDFSGMEGRRGRRGTTDGFPAAGERDGGNRGLPPSGDGAPAVARVEPPPVPVEGASTPAAPVPPAPPAAPEPGPPRQGGEQAPPPPALPSSGAAGSTSAAASAADTDRILIDVGPIRRDIVRQFVPDGQWEQLSEEERRRIIGQVNERMMGIAQGIQLGAAEAQKRAEEAQKAAESKAAALEGRATRAAKASPAAPAAASTAARPAAVSTRRRSALTGNRLDVTVEQNGQVVRAANVDLNLPNVLATIFATTRRDQGEIPFAVGKDGHVFTPTDAERTQIEALGGDFLRPDTAAGTSRIGNWVVVSTADPTGSGLKFGIARPVGNSLDDLRRSSLRNAAVGLGFIGLALIGIVPISSRLTSKLSLLSDGVRRIAHGDYGARIDVTSTDEVGRLASAFNQMAADVEFHQRAAVERERITRELELGRQIQNDLLPQSPLRLGATEIAGVSVPAREVGGDFFNYFVLEDGRVAMLVGDVSGKGVGAALLMANIQASLRTRLSMGQPLEAVARQIDIEVDESTHTALYATLVIGIMDPVSRELRYVNAGHNPQYAVHRDGTLDRLSSSGLPVGLLPGRGYDEATLQLTPGDRLFFYTDGCTEMENEAGDMFGADRLEALLQSFAREPDLLARVEGEVATFRGTREPLDDATMMVVTVG